MQAVCPSATGGSGASTAATSATVPGGGSPLPTGIIVAIVVFVVVFVFLTLFVGIIIGARFEKFRNVFPIVKKYPQYFGGEYSNQLQMIDDDNEIEKVTEEEKAENNKL